MDPKNHDHTLMVKIKRAIYKTEKYLNFKIFNAYTSKYHKEHIYSLTFSFGGHVICRPPKIQVTLLGSEFNVDYDFTIKHDPIQSDD